MLNCEMIAQANTILETFYEEFSTLPLPRFGGDMLRDHDPRGYVVAAATIRHRFLKSFSKPDPTVKKQLTKLCNQGWVAFEEELGKFNFYAHSPDARGVVYRARELLHSWLADFKVSLSAMPEFTPGETFTSQMGYVSIYQKLRRKDAWTVTPDAADDFIRLCYNTLSLKRAAKRHMVPLTRSAKRRLGAAFPKGEPNAGFLVFRARMYGEVLTLVHGSRGSSVDKSRDKRRFINVEPLGNVILQRIVAAELRRILKSLRNDLEIGQAVHMRRIRKLIATIDFSNASDGVIKKMVQLTFPGACFRYLNRYRSPMVLVGDDYYVPFKLSSMGCGFTFEVMTLLLLAIARTMDADATVYGDDVIIDNASAHKFIAAAQAVGFRVNHEKTFIDSPFRESCGAFYMDGYGDITCYEIHYCESVADVITATNKFYKMWQDNPDHYCTDLCRRAYEALISVVPPCFIGPVTPGELQSEFAMSPEYRVKHMRDQSCRALWSNVASRYGDAFHLICYELKDVCFVSVPRMQLKPASKRLVELPNMGPKYASYLYAGRIADDYIRNSEVEVFNLCAVLPGGLLIPVKYLKTALSDEKVRLDKWLEQHLLFDPLRAKPVEGRATQPPSVRPRAAGPTPAKIH